MKKIIKIFMIGAMLLCATACSSGTDYEEPETGISSEVETEATTQTPDGGSENFEDLDEYYSFIKEDNDGNVHIMVTPEEFIENYNKVIVGKGENGQTYDVSLNDFEFLQKGKVRGRTTSFYSCPLTIFGRNNGIAITLEVYDDDNTIVAVQLGLKNYYIYDSDANRDIIPRFIEQYSYLMRGLGLSASEVDNIMYELDYNESNYSSYSLYKKGLAFGFNKDGNDTGWYRIFPASKEMAEEHDKTYLE